MSFTHLSDTELLARQRSVATEMRALQAVATGLAAEIDHRSRRELGYDGLAAKQGFRTPEALVQHLTGASAPTARRLVRVGVLAATPSAEPWLAAPLALLGAISAEAIDAIRTGLGSPSETVTMDALTRTAETLASWAPHLTLERLAARAHELRDDLDTAAVAAREEELRTRRSLRLIPQADGMTRLTALLDPESAAVITGAIDAATSPRRGPRFVDPADAPVPHDARTLEQLALDSLVELVDVAVRHRSSEVLGARRADVRLLVTARDLDVRDGVGFIAGQRAGVSIATVERHACDGGYVPILFDDDGAALNLGRAQRLHSSRQRTAIAARDGGCLHPDCDRPPSYCEVHHIVEFSHGGSTSVDDGVLLCRFHHLWVHNNGWRIDREGSIYMLIPPRDIDPQQRAREMPTKSAAMRRLLVRA